MDMKVEIVVRGDGGGGDDAGSHLRACRAKRRLLHIRASDSAAPALTSALRGSQSAAPATKSALRASQISVLCLPRALHFEVDKVLRLLRTLHFEVYKVLRLPRNLRFEVHKVLRLPRFLSHMSKSHDALHLQSRNQSTSKITTASKLVLHLPRNRSKADPIPCACHEFSVFCKQRIGRTPRCRCNTLIQHQPLTPTVRTPIVCPHCLGNEKESMKPQVADVVLQ